MAKGDNMYQISLTKEQLQILYEMVLEGKSMEPSETEETICAIICQAVNDSYEVD